MIQQNKNNGRNIDYKFILTVLGMIGVGLFWIFTINGVPQRVRILETKMEMVEKSIVKNETQMQLMLNAIYEIRSNVQNITLNMKTGVRNNE